MMTFVFAKQRVFTMPEYLKYIQDQLHIDSLVIKKEGKKEGRKGGRTK